MSAREGSLPEPVASGDRQPGFYTSRNDRGFPEGRFLARSRIGNTTVYRGRTPFPAPRYSRAEHLVVRARRREYLPVRWRLKQMREPKQPKEEESRSVIGDG